MAKTNSEQEPSAGMTMPLKLLFGASLALNLAIVGLVAGIWLSGGPRGPDGPGGRPGLRPAALAPAFVRALDRSEQRELRRSLRRELGSMGPGAGSARPDVDQIVDVLTAEPFDAAAFDRLLIAGPSQTARRHEVGRALLTATIAKMDSEKRALYAERVRKELTRKRKRRRD